MTTYTGDKPFNPDTTWEITTITPALSFRDLAALALMQGRTYDYNHDVVSKNVFDLADAMDAERNRRNSV